MTTLRAAVWTAEDEVAEDERPVTEVPVRAVTDGRAGQDCLEVLVTPLRGKADQ